VRHLAASLTAGVQRLVRGCLAPGGGALPLGKTRVNGRGTSLIGFNLTVAVSNFHIALMDVYAPVSKLWELEPDAKVPGAAKGVCLGFDLDCPDGVDGDEATAKYRARLRARTPEYSTSRAFDLRVVYKFEDRCRVVGVSGFDATEVGDYYAELLSGPDGTGATVEAQAHFEIVPGSPGVL